VAPKVTLRGKTNDITWNVALRKTARFYMKTDTADTAVTIDVLDSKNVVVRRMYSGAGPKPRVTKWTSLWSGKDSGGHWLATGTYKYRVVVTKAGQSATSIGTIVVRTPLVLVVVPDVYHVFLTNAEVRLKRLGFRVGLRWVYMGDPDYRGAGHGNVDRQVPAAGTVRPKGSPVTIWIAYEHS